jgi:hypothetical protein
MNEPHAVKKIGMMLEFSPQHAKGELGQEFTKSDPSLCM